MIIAVAIMVGAPDSAQFLTQIRSMIADGIDAPLFNRAKQAASRDLFDPYSAQFNDLKKVDTDIGLVVCGYVNAKNRMGAYVGAKRFVYEDMIKLSIIDSEETTRAVFASDFKYCDPGYRKPDSSSGKSDKEVKIDVPLPAYPPPLTSQK